MSKIWTFTWQGKILIFGRENNFSNIVNEILVLKFFRFRMVILFCKLYVKCVILKFRTWAGVRTLGMLPYNVLSKLFISFKLNIQPKFNFCFNFHNMYCWNLIPDSNSEGGVENLNALCEILSALTSLIFIYEAGGYVS